MGGGDQPNAIRKDKEDHGANVSVEIGVDAVLLVVERHLRVVDTIDLLDVRGEPRSHFGRGARRHLLAVLHNDVVEKVLHVTERGNTHSGEISVQNVPCAK